MEGYDGRAKGRRIEGLTVIFALEEEVLLLLAEEREECYLVVRGEALIVQEEAPKGPVFQRVRWRRGPLESS